MHTDTPFDYILGCKLPKDKKVRDQVITCGGCYQKLEDNLEVKEGGKRLVGTLV